MKRVCLFFVLLLTASVLHAQVKVVAPINPNSPLDLYPTHIDSLGHGGFMSVSSIASRNAISSLRRKQGMLVYVSATDSIYQLTGGTANTNWLGFKLGSAGEGSSIVWKGSLALPPADPVKNWAYYNTPDKKSYIWDGDSWEILAQDGAQGPQGENSIVWKSMLPAPPSNPLQNWAYFNTTSRTSFIWNADNRTWDTLAPGALGFNYEGMGYDPDLDPIPTDPPPHPALNTLYRDVNNGVIYVFNGTDWVVFVRDGIEGERGLPGPQGPPGAITNGVLKWLGEFDSYPPNEDWLTNAAYYSRTARKSYIYDGHDWQVLAQDGIQMQWIGSLPYQPSATQTFQAYYNTTLRKSYFWAYNAQTREIGWNVFAESPSLDLNAVQTFRDSVIFANPGEATLSNNESVVIESKIRLPFSPYGTWDPERFNNPAYSPQLRRFVLGMSDSSTMSLVEVMPEFVGVGGSFIVGKKTMNANAVFDTVIALKPVWNLSNRSQQDLDAIDFYLQVVAGPSVSIAHKTAGGYIPPIGLPSITSPVLPENIVISFVKLVRLDGLYPKTAASSYLYAHVRLKNTSDKDIVIDANTELNVNALAMIPRTFFTK